MLIHPLEGFGYYCILYSPAFLVHMHFASFAAYMSIMGLAGVIDHCGVKVEIPGLYNSADHDKHHSGSQGSQFVCILHCFIFHFPAQQT